MKQAKLKDLFDYLPKSKVQAGEGFAKGMYPFYTSSENQTKYLNEYQHDPGCLVFGTGGKASLHFTTRRFSTSTDCITIKPKPDLQIDAAYVFQYFKGNMQVLENGFKGAGLKHISKAYLSDIQIPYPEDIDDQRRIAHLLVKIDGLIAQRKQHLQRLDDLLKSVFLEMFGDPILNPHGFPVKKLSEFYVNPKEGTKCGPFGSALKKEELVDAGVPVWNMDNIDSNGRMSLQFRMWITADKYDELAAYSVKDGDIIISRAGTVGKMCVARMNGQSAIISTNLIRLRLGNELRPLHFVSLMLYCKGRVGRLKTGADGAFTHMNTGVLDSLELPYPPVELQDLFGEIATKVEGVKSRYQQSLADLEALYGALSKQAFKGELNLSRVPLPGIQPEEEKVVATDPLQSPVEQGQAIHLPNSANMLAALESTEARKNLLAQWLDAYRNQLGSTPFSVQDFMEEAQTQLVKLHKDGDFELGSNDYEHIKAWVFEALAAGTLKQAFDDAGNRIELKAA
ncbi:restriction endonuclease subunit S [Rhodoferax sp. TBRC 17198]|uniref:restriction endonuclease subunit S n=1 Tax=Rhodoferax potami TaxID=3068338 RepID=UPI0028BE9E07|nr:restriction endonuclease subunit S [Rhodoferax sp. TBRC 17198]MDT7521081.1 restriction endonuclease subunit S [Rhodoferax sp. TBRC 17198]